MTTCPDCGADMALDHAKMTPEMDARPVEEWPTRCIPCWAKAQTLEAPLDHGTNRCDLPGFRLVAMYDPVKRRGIWSRIQPWDEIDTVPIRRIELIGGREGDDAEVVLDVGATITAEMLEGLADVLSRGAAWGWLGPDELAVLRGDDEAQR